MAGVGGVPTSASLGSSPLSIPASPGELPSPAVLDGARYSSCMTRLSKLRLDRFDTAGCAESSIPTNRRLPRYIRASHPRPAPPAPFRSPTIIVVVVVGGFRDPNKISPSPRYLRASAAAAGLSAPEPFPLTDLYSNHSILNPFQRVSIARSDTRGGRSSVVAHRIYLNLRSYPSRPSLSLAAYSYFKNKTRAIKS